MTSNLLALVPEYLLTEIRASFPEDGDVWLLSKNVRMEFEDDSFRVSEGSKTLGFLDPEDLGIERPKTGKNRRKK